MGRYSHTDRRTTLLHQASVHAAQHSLASHMQPFNQAAALTCTLALGQLLSPSSQREGLEILLDPPAAHTRCISSTGALLDAHAGHDEA